MSDRRAVGSSARSHHHAGGGTESERTLHDLGRELFRRRARAARAWRRYAALDNELDPEEHARAHEAWSQAIDEALVTSELISRHRALTLDELLVQFEAVWWWIGEDDNVLDGSTRRWLTRFRRSLRRLAA